MWGVTYLLPAVRLRLVDVRLLAHADLTAHLR